MKNKDIKKYFATSYLASDVNEDDIFKSIDFPNNINDIETVILIHNHPDFYERCVINENYSNKVIGFLSNGSFSHKDIEFFEKFNITFLKKRIPLIC